MDGRHVLAFIHNDSARFALIRGDSPPAVSRDLLAVVAARDARFPVPAFYYRCPSASNLADAPSRLGFEAWFGRKVAVSAEQRAVVLAA